MCFNVSEESAPRACSQGSGRRVPPPARPHCAASAADDGGKDPVVLCAVRALGYHNTHGRAVVPLLPHPHRLRHRHLLVIDLACFSGPRLELTDIIYALNANPMAFRRPDSYLVTRHDPETYTSYIGVALAIPAHTTIRTTADPERQVVFFEVDAAQVIELAEPIAHPFP